jgi:hypothetical protein
MSENNPNLTARQKRAINQVKRALQHLTELTDNDPRFFNGTIAMLSGTVGTMIGAMSAASSLPVEDAHESTIKVARYIQEQSAKAYAEYMAREAAASCKQ